ncbi:MAG: tRNA (guanosine(46)-N7)-methyltransferase TrmB [Gammaproteobacteria bacterium]|nr:tRNA (guanosine(46)-N7)-methyltransferase TrmB [Gammaproteobacteria bacterium]MDP2139545.1 tRNA (guanosine(46)-N7)-methyltransferase TrmB [Gammaproteobacteria bacterium]MDP2346518.1 tRNA (guanosine(46)-N7)-methyltransferase TrmB [Gammaproteobacteria bacterium]
MRAIRSYVIRGGRLTSSQQHALDNYWPKYGITNNKGAFDSERTFGRIAPLVMEIGFGMGDSLLSMAINNPDKNFIGVEVHKPGVGRLLHEIEANSLNNLRLFCHDAKEILRDCIADGQLDTVQIFFPDPWHKKKHNKRRLVQLDFMELVRQKLAIGGSVHMATDWEPYAEHMMEVMISAPGYANAAGAGQYSLNTDRPITKFEKRGQRLGHAVHDLIFIREA